MVDYFISFGELAKFEEIWQFQPAKSSQIKAMMGSIRGTCNKSGNVVIGKREHVKFTFIEKREDRGSIEEGREEMGTSNS